MVLLCCLAARPAGAQAVDGPPGSSGGLFGGHRPVDPNRVSQQLSLNFDLSGGYDSRADGGLIGDSDQPFQPMYASSAQSGLRYWRGSVNRFVEASARGRGNYESTTRLQTIGGEVLVQGSSSLGRRLQLSGGGLFSYEPAALATQFAPALGSTDAEVTLDHTPPGGVVQQQWLAGSAYVNLVRSWSARHATTLELRGSRREPFDGAGLESHSQQATLVHSWNLRPSAAFRAQYSFDDSRQGFQTVTASPLRTSTVNFGMNLQRRFSPIRTLFFEFAGGAAFAERMASAESAPLDFVLPVVSGSVRFNLTGIWSVSFDAEHNISVLEGVTPEPFATNIGTVQLQATLSERLTFGVAGVYSKGSGIETNTGAFDTAEAQAQFRYGLGRCCGVFSSYSFYSHHVRDVANLAPDFPEQYRRHVARVGMTFWLPLYGSF